MKTKYENIRRVLFIAYHFPPSASTGAIRPMKFVKYLGDYGWPPVVLTCRDSFDFGTDRNHDLLKDIPENVVVCRTMTFEPLNILWKRKNRHLSASQIKQASGSERRILKSVGFLFLVRMFILDIMNIPDRYQGWIIFALFRGIGIILKERISVIYATTPPPSALVVGYLLSVLTGKPLIVDYRDPWAHARWARKYYGIFEYINRAIEKAILKRARYIISVSDVRSNDLACEYPNINSKKHVVIHNGYDIADNHVRKSTSFNKFTFLHAGTLYNSDGVSEFMNIITDIARKDSEFRRNSSIVFVGSMPEAKSFEILREMGIAEYRGRIPRGECFDIMSKAHVLLVFLMNDGFNKGCIASKIFDYMMLKRPVFAVTPRGETASLIEKAGIGVSFDPVDREGMQNEILRLYRQYSGGALSITPNEEYIKRYDRKELTRKLAMLLDKVAENE